MSFVTNLIKYASVIRKLAGSGGGGSGDMTKAIYDPANKAAQVVVTTDHISAALIDETSTAKIMTDTERTKLTGIEAAADVTDAANVGLSIHGATAKTTLADADELAMIDSAASNVLKRITWANLRAATSGGVAFKLLFDTQTTTTDPGTNKCNFSADGNTFVVSNTALGSVDLQEYFSTTVFRGVLHWKSNTLNSAAFGEFQVTNATLGGGSTFFSFTGSSTNIGGDLPADGEEIVLWYERISSPSDVMAVALEGDVARFDAQYQLIDKNGVKRSGTASVATYADLLALNVVDYAGFCVVVESLSNKPVFKSDGSNWLPLQGGYNHDQSNLTIKKVICANQVTWSAANNGGTVQLTGTAHGLTSAAVGYSLYLTNSPTNWTAGSFHEITAVPNANTVNVSTAFVASMGVPTFAAAASTKIPVLLLTVPALRPNSRYLLDMGLRGQVDASATGNRVYVALGATDITQLTYSAASNEAFPFRSGFFNQNNASVQRGRFGKSSSGSGSGSDYVATAVDTSTGTQVITVYLYCGVVNFGLELSDYIVRVEG